MEIDKIIPYRIRLISLKGNRAGLFVPLGFLCRLDGMEPFGLCSKAAAKTAIHTCRNRTLRPVCTTHNPQALLRWHEVVIHTYRKVSLPLFSSVRRKG